MNAFATKILHWFTQHGRHDLPWQIDNTPYHTWVSEIMLQQTQVKSVIPYYQKFISHFPDVKTLAKASLDDVFSLWSGLGYYARAKNLHNCAKYIVNECHGELPKTKEGLYSLPGVGKTTAHAIYTLSYDKPAAILDGNVKRVIARCFKVSGPPNTASTQTKLWQLATELAPNKKCRDYTQAMMDLGALVCTRSKPKCPQCPLITDCMAYKENCVQNYPEKQQRKQKPEKTANFIVFGMKNKIYLIKRPLSGIWGGLWSLPEMDDDTLKTINNVHQEFPPKTLPCFKHIFTHYTLTLKPVFFKVTTSTPLKLPFVTEQEGRWWTVEEALKLGLPKPIRQILSMKFASEHLALI